MSKVEVTEEIKSSKKSIFGAICFCEQCGTIYAGGSEMVAYNHSLTHEALHDYQRRAGGDDEGK